MNDRIYEAGAQTARVNYWHGMSNAGLFAAVRPNDHAEWSQGYLAELKKLGINRETGPNAAHRWGKDQ